MSAGEESSEFKAAVVGPVAVGFFLVLRAMSGGYASSSLLAAFSTVFSSDVRKTPAAVAPGTARAWSLVLLAVDAGDVAPARFFGSRAPWTVLLV